MQVLALLGGPGPRVHAGPDCVVARVGRGVA